MYNQLAKAKIRLKGAWVGSTDLENRLLLLFLKGLGADLSLVSFEAINLREDPVHGEVVGNRVHRLAHDRGSHLARGKVGHKLGG